MSALELKIPPPILALIVGVLMWLVPPLVSFAAFAPAARIPIAACLAIAGVSLVVAGGVSLHRARTTVNPIKPGTTSFLVVTGVHRYSRNPMYLGVVIVLLGWDIQLASAAAFAFVPAFVLYINRFQIAVEERVLAQLFGPDYLAYKGRVRRWL